SVSSSSDFFQKVIQNGGLEGPFSRGMTGRIGLTQLIAEFEKDCKEAAAASGKPLPEGFSMAQIFEEMATSDTWNAPILQAALTLKNHGFRIAVLTNNWVDDSPHRHRTGLALCLLRRYFDGVIESCRIGLQKPDPKIYEYALDQLKAKPEEVIFLDDIGANLKPARAMGIATILVRDTDSALKELQHLTGVQLLNQEENVPPACEPDSVAHGYVTIKPQTKLHFVEMGSGPVVCLCHGFPESWFSWRYQIPALADAGFRVIALEMKGYGDSTAPAAVEEYSQEEICKVGHGIKIDCIGISQATFVGHDWGGATVWGMALFYPERVRAVAGLNTPYRPADPEVDIMKLTESHPVFDYQLYFQEPVSRTCASGTGLHGRFHAGHFCAAGGLLVGLPENPPPSSLLPPPVLQYYVEQYQKSGFRGPLNWYRNLRENWRWNATARDRKIHVPALMVTAGKDIVLHPKMSERMEEWVSGRAGGPVGQRLCWQRELACGSATRIFGLSSRAQLQGLSC
uniref:Epoxide hydrolase 2 n=1 Tax=Varanus komodoensis TaxID=61221 RepID=A0A8D2ITK1_VARKO